jgi:hypothetical protein
MECMSDFISSLMGKFLSAKPASEIQQFQSRIRKFQYRVDPYGAGIVPLQVSGLPETMFSIGDATKWPLVYSYLEANRKFVFQEIHYNLSLIMESRGLKLGLTDRDEADLMTSVSATVCKLVLDSGYYLSDPTLKNEQYESNRKLRVQSLADRCGSDVCSAVFVAASENMLARGMGFSAVSSTIMASLEAGLCPRCWVGGLDDGFLAVVDIRRIDDGDHQ